MISEIWHTVLVGFAEHVLRIMLGILSGPVDFDILIFNRSLITPFTVITRGGNSFLHLFSIGIAGIFLEVTFVNTDLNWSTNMFEFPFMSLSTVNLHLFSIGIAGIFLEVTFVNTDLNWSTNMFEFPFMSLSTVPFFLSGGVPTLSCCLDLMYFQNGFVNMTYIYI